MSDFVADRSPPVPLVALAGWLLPGLGYWLIGQRWRAVVAGVTITLLFVGGLLIGGIRVIDVPGYAQGNKIVRQGQWVLLNGDQIIPTVVDKPWYIPQLLMGPATIGASWLSLAAARHVDMPHAHVRDVGTLYTAVAGMLNLFILIDAAHRATKLQA